MHIFFYNKFISCLYMFRAYVLIIMRSKLHYTASGIITPIGGRLMHETATYRCDVMQFLPPVDEHMCSKHVEAWNKLIVKQTFCASSWLITEINILRCTVSKTSKYLLVLSHPVHQTATYRCDDTRGCVTQFWTPDDEHMCSKHVEAWNKLIVKQTFCASNSLITEINTLCPGHPTQTTKNWPQITHYAVTSHDKEAHLLIESRFGKRVQRHRAQGAVVQCTVEGRVQFLDTVYGFIVNDVALDRLFDKIAVFPFQQTFDSRYIVRCHVPHCVRHDWPTTTPVTSCILT